MKHQTLAKEYSKYQIIEHKLTAYILFAILMLLFAFPIILIWKGWN